MLQIFQYDFMIRAFVAGMMVALIAPTIGMFLVLRRYAFMADSLSHVALAGVALGAIAGIFPPLVAFVVTLCAAVFIEYLREYKHISGESALAMILSGGLAVAVVLFSLGNGLNVNVLQYLFGSIVTVQQGDLALVLALGIVVALSVLLFWKELVYISFDEEGARVQGLKVRALNMLLVVLTAATVALSLRIVGVLLVGSLMVIPVISAVQVGKSFFSTTLIAVLFGLVSVIVGLFAAFYWNIAAGGAVVIAAFACFFVSLLISRIRAV